MTIPKVGTLTQTRIIDIDALILKKSFVINRNHVFCFFLNLY